MDIFNIVCGVCSIISLLVSLFTASKVIKIAQSINLGNKDDHSKVINKNGNNTIFGPYVGNSINRVEK